MPVQRIDHLNLRADRALLDVLRSFYVDALGLVDGERPPFDNRGYWLYAGAVPVIHLSEAAPDEVHASGVSGTVDHVAFSCADLPHHEARLRTLGIGYRRAQVPRTGQVQLFFKDPAGNGVELSFATGDD